jgi:uncharacterized repeat protein (TIGR03899 family)
MKIETNLQPLPVTPSNAPTGKKIDKPVTAKHKVSEKLDKAATQKRMVHWFSQVGVSNSYAALGAQPINEKILRRNKMSAQRKLNNLENILGRALDFCLDDGRVDMLDPDWFFSFVDMAENIYSPGMQELWGKIFAVETARPGSFSLRTLQTLKQLTHKDAQVLRTVVSLASRRKGESTPKVILGYYQKSSLWSFLSTHKEHQLNLAEFGLSYPDLLSLMDLGLIHHSEIESGELAINIRTEWRCAGQHVHLSPMRRGTTLVYYKFTTTGAELFKLVGSHKQENYVNVLKQLLSKAFEVN